MDWCGYEDEQHTLKGIAALLLGFAVLAQLLYVLPHRIRVVVLSILRPAEAASRAFATEQTRGALALPPAAVPGVDGDSRAAALQLARCFCALASFFCGLWALTVARRPFRGRLNRLFAPRVPAIAWRCHAMQLPDAMAFRAAHIDTS